MIQFLIIFLFNICNALEWTDFNVIDSKTAVNNVPPSQSIKDSNAGNELPDFLKNKNLIIAEPLAQPEVYEPVTTFNIAGGLMVSSFSPMQRNYSLGLGFTLPFNFDFSLWAVYKKHMRFDADYIIFFKNSYMTNRNIGLITGFSFFSVTSDLSESFFMIKYYSPVLGLRLMSRDRNTDLSVFVDLKCSYNFNRAEDNSVMLMFVLGMAFPV